MIRIATAAALATGLLGADVPRIPATTEIVHVEVLVTDARGRPVTDLARDAFTLTQDGRPVPIVAFQAPGTPLTPPSVTQPSPTPAATAPGELTTLVVFVDNRSLSPASRRRLLDGLEPFLKDQLAAGRARALVFTEDHGTRALTGITTDPQEVSRALAVARRAATGRSAIVMAERTAVELLREAIENAERAGVPCTQSMRQVLPIVNAHAATRRDQLTDTLARLSAVIAAVSVIPGPKALLYLSEGFEQRPALHLYDWLADVCPAIREADSSLLFTPASEGDLSAPLRSVAARANAARLTIYALDGSAVGTLSAADVAQEGSDAASPGPGTQQAHRWAPSASTDRLAVLNLRGGEQILARETGGRIVSDAGRMADLATDLGRRYAIGFSPGHAPDGRTHRLEVEVRGKGLRVRHRLTYLHVERPDPGVTRTLAALATGLSSDTLGATAVLDGAGRVRITVPIAGVAPDPESGGARGRLRIVVAVLRPRKAGAPTAPEVREKLVDVDLAGAGPVREIVIELPPAAAPPEIAVGVEDAFSFRATWARLGPDPP